MTTLRKTGDSLGLRWMFDRALAQHEEKDPYGYGMELIQTLSQPELDVIFGDEPIPVGFAAKFARAISEPLLASIVPESCDAKSCKAAFRLAVAIGYCRLYGVELGELDGDLPAQIAAAAAREFEVQLGRWTAKAQRLGREWDNTEDSIEGEFLLCDFVFARMDFWAALVALEEAYMSCLETCEPGSIRLYEASPEIVSKLERFDLALQGEQDLLCLVADSELLDNLRGLLAEPYRSVLPWWLDGTLEAELERVEAVARATMPRR